jgi:ribose transport system permease protein
MKTKVNLGMERFSGLYLWAAFIIVFGILSPHEFLSITTAQIIASQQAVAAMVALALLIPMVCGEFDLSVGATANACGLIAVALQNGGSHFGVIPALIASVAVGGFIGLVNGFVVVRLGVSSFIATLGMGSILAAVVTMVTHGETPISPGAPLWMNMTQKSIGGFQIVIIYLIVIALLAWWLLGHTPAGRYLYATGANREAARLAGLRTGRWSWLSLTIAGAVAGLAGVLYCSLTAPSLDFGSGLLLPAFAAVFLGSTQLIPGRFNVWGTILAIVVLATGATGLQLVTGVQWIQDLFNGLALIFAVALSAQRQKLGWFRRRRSSGRPGSAPDRLGLDTPRQEASSAALSE